MAGTDEEFARRIMMMFGEVAAPTALVLGYAFYGFIRAGLAPQFYPYTYLPLAGSLASIAGAFLYSVTLLQQGHRSWFRFLAIEAGLVPYIFGLYVFAFFGVYGIWCSLNPFALPSLLAGVLWMLIGHRIVYRIYLLSEIGRPDVSSPDR